MAETIDNNQALKDACLVVRYEDLCSRPKDSLIQISRHCGLDFEAADLDGLAGRLRFPSYYKTSFTAQEVEIIARETNDVRSSLGYPASEGAGGATAEELLKTGG